MLWEEEGEQNGKVERRERWTKVEWDRDKRINIECMCTHMEWSQKER